MKKLVRNFIILLLVLLIVVLTSCSGQIETEQSIDSHSISTKEETSQIVTEFIESSTEPTSKNTFMETTSESMSIVTTNDDTKNETTSKNVLTETTIESVVTENTTNGMETTTESMFVETTTESMFVETTTESMSVETTTESMSVETTTESMSVETTTESMSVETTTESMSVETTTESTLIETTTESIATETTESIPIETTTGNTPIETTDLNGHYYSKFCSSNNISVKTFKTTKNIYIFDYYTQYYDGYNDDIFTLCFDPLCDHKKSTCILNMFPSMKSAICNEYNSRIYVSVGDCLYSFKTTGSDVKLEISFSDYGKDLTNSQFLKENIRNLNYFDNYIFFSFSSVDKNNNRSYMNWYRYDTITKELKQITNNGSSSTTNTKIQYVIGENKLLISVSTNETNYYVADFDASNIYRIDDETLYNMLGVSGYTFNGRYLVGVNINDSRKIIRAYDTYNNTSRILGTFDLLSSILILDSDEQYVYYSIKDPFFIGVEVDRQGREHEVYNNYHTIYRLSLNDMTNELIFEGVSSDDVSVPSYEITELTIIKNRVWLVGHEYTNDDILITNKSITGVYRIDNSFIIIDPEHKV